MRKAINTCVRLCAETFELAPPVVEVGSYYLPGYDWLCDLRPYFAGREYIGCDIRSGPGVDRIEDAQALSFANGSVGTLLSFETLEHLPEPGRALTEAHRVLRDDGVMVLSVPFNYRLHGFPTDYWRFSASGVHVLLRSFADKIILAIGPRVKPAFIFGIAAKTATQGFTENKIRFRARVEETFGSKPSRIRGHASVLKERARDLLGQISGRADLGVAFFDESQAGGYQASVSSRPHARNPAEPAD